MIRPSNSPICARCMSSARSSKAICWRSIPACRPPSRPGLWGRRCRAGSKRWAALSMDAPGWARCVSAWTRPTRRAGWSGWKSTLRSIANFHLAGFALALVLATAQARADDLQLSTMIHAAMDHGSKLQHADIALKLAQARLQEAEGAFDWSGSGKIGVSRVYYPRTQTVGGVSVPTNKLDSSTAEQVTAGFSKLFRDGIQIQPGISYYPDLSASSAQTFGLTRPIPSLNLQIPLLHTFDGNNAAAANERAADFGVAGASLERNAGLQQSVLEAVQVYWRCLAANEEQGILADRHASSQTYLESLRKLAAAGQTEAATVQRETAR